VILIELRVGSLRVIMNSRTSQGVIFKPATT
jgi:hypothetical protein